MGYPPRKASRVPRRFASAGETAGRELLESDARLSTEDETGDRVPHGGSVEDALAGTAGGHVEPIECGHAAEHQEPVRGHRAQTGGLLRDLRVGHRRQHPDERVADLVARGDARLLVEAGFLLGRPRPQETVGLGRGVVVAPADGTFDRRTWSLQAEDLALERTDGDRHADPVRGLGAPGPEREHRARAAQRLPLEDHAGDAPAVAAQTDRAPVPHPHAEALGGPGEGQHQTIGLDGAPALGERRPDRLVRDPRLDPPRGRAVEPAHRVARLLLLPRQRGLEPPHVVLGEGQRQRRAYTEVHVDPGLLDEALRELAMQSHTVLGDLGHRPGDAEAAQRAQPAVREPRGVAADRVALDDHARHARLRQVVSRRHAHDAAAHDHDVRRALSHGPEMLSKSIRPVKRGEADPLRVYSRAMLRARRGTMKRIGVLGGVSPQATMDFEARVHRVSQQLIPQDFNRGYPPMVVWYHRRPPVRLEADGRAIMPMELDPELVEAAAWLGTMADFLVIPCNAAHVGLDSIQT